MRALIVGDGQVGVAQQELGAEAERRLSSSTACTSARLYGWVSAAASSMRAPGRPHPGAFQNDAVALAARVDDARFAQHLELRSAWPRPRRWPRAASLRADPANRRLACAAADAAPAASRATVRIVPSTGLAHRRGYATSLAWLSASARSVGVSSVASASACEKPRSSCDRMTPELPRAPSIAASYAERATWLTGASSASCLQAVDRGLQRHRHVGARVAVGHREHVQRVDRARRSPRATPPPTAALPASRHPSRAFDPVAGRRRRGHASAAYASLPSIALLRERLGSESEHSRGEPLSTCVARVWPSATTSATRTARPIDACCPTFRRRRCWSTARRGASTPARAASARCASSGDRPDQASARLRAAMLASGPSPSR